MQVTTYIRKTLYIACFIIINRIKRHTCFLIQIISNDCPLSNSNGEVCSLISSTHKDQTHRANLHKQCFAYFHRKHAFQTETVDKTTDNSIVSMQELIPALNAFKSATGAADDELKNVTPSMANFGAAVLAQTGSVDRAQQAMMDLSKGYKGAYASLDQYGISKDALVRTGYWSGFAYFHRKHAFQTKK